MTWKRVFAPALWATICAGLALQSCETPPSSSEGTSKLRVSQDAPDNVVAVPDLEVHPELDPLSITIDKVGLANFMGDDSLAVVLDDLYTYFHLSNVGEWDAMFEHFPGHRTADTAMLTVQKEMMDKWFHNGLRNRAGGCHIRYASPWVDEGDQQVALLGLDLNYFLDFFENFEGNPESEEHLQYEIEVAADIRQLNNAFRADGGEESEHQREHHVIGKGRPQIKQDDRRKQ